jgi:hypothetical protein
MSYRLATISQAGLQGAFKRKPRRRNSIRRINLTSGKSRQVFCRQDLIVIGEELVVGTVLTFVVVGTQFEKDPARQHVPAFFVQMRLAHDLSPTGRGILLLSQLPVDFLIKGTGSAIEGVVAGFEIHHPGFHPHTLLFVQGNNLNPLALLFALRFHNLSP